MKLLGIGDKTVRGTVVSIHRDGVVFRTEKGKRVVLTLTEAELMVCNNGGR